MPPGASSGGWVIAGRESCPTLQMARSGLGVMSSWRSRSGLPVGSSSPKPNPPVRPISSSARQQQACSRERGAETHSGAAHRLGLIGRGAGVDPCEASHERSSSIMQPCFRSAAGPPLPRYQRRARWPTMTFPRRGLP